MVGKNRVPATFSWQKCSRYLKEIPGLDPVFLYCLSNYYSAAVTFVKREANENMSGSYPGSHHISPNGG